MEGLGEPGLTRITGSIRLKVLKTAQTYDNAGLDAHRDFRTGKVYLFLGGIRFGVDVLGNMILECINI